MNTQVFKINDNEWWLGQATPQQILQAYMQETGLTQEEATGNPNWLPVPLDENALDNLRFTHDEAGQKLAAPVSFRDRMNEMLASGKALPCFFAGGDW